MEDGIKIIEVQEFVRRLKYLIEHKKAKLSVTIQGIVNGAPLSAAIIPSKTSNPFFLIVEM